MTKFHRPKAYAMPSNTDDATGTVRITITLAKKGGGTTKGNISRTISVADTKVSDVATFVDNALFPEDADQEPDDR